MKVMTLQKYIDKETSQPSLLPFLTLLLRRETRCKYARDAIDAIDTMRYWPRDTDTTQTEQIPTAFKDTGK